MNIYIPDEVYTLSIRRAGDKTTDVTVWKCTLEECKSKLMEIIGSEITPFESGRVTGIDIRRRIGGNNLESESISFRGLSPIETKALILKNLT